MPLPLYLLSREQETESWFVVRTAPPRFIAEIVAPEDVDPVGLYFTDGEGLNVAQWIDPPPAPEVMDTILAEIYQMLNEAEG